MIEGIKNLINQKIAFQEATDMILGEAAGGASDLDDLIVLGEEGDPEEDEELHEGEDHEEDDDDEKDKDDHEESDEPKLPEVKEDDEDPMSTPISDSPAADPAPGTDEPIVSDDEDPMNEPIGDDLPTPVGAQTGEPIEGDDDDVMKMEIDLGSNTISNALPIPPANAGEAIASDDISKQNVESGFGESGNHKIKITIGRGPKEVPVSQETKDSLSKFIGEQIKSGKVKTVKVSDIEKFFSRDEDMNESANYPGKSKLPQKVKDELIKLANSKTPITIEELDKLGDNGPIEFEDDGSDKKKPIKPMVIYVYDSAYTEAISLAGGMEGESEPPAADPAPAEGGDPAPDVAASSGEENTVTAAVRDKVNESEEGESEDDPAASEDTSKEALINKLSDITKKLEDAKKAVMGAIS